MEETNTAVPTPLPIDAPPPVDFKEEEAAARDGSAISPTTESGGGDKCLRRLRNNKPALLAIHAGLVLLCIGVIGFAVLLVVVAIYFRTGTLSGKTGWHGNVMASILIVYMSILFIFLLFAYCRRRFSLLGREKDDNAALETTEETKENENSSVLQDIDEVNENGCASKDTEEMKEEHDAITPLGDKEETAEGIDNHIFNGAKPSTRQVKKFLLCAILPLTTLLLVGAEIYFILVAPTTSVFPLYMIGVQDAIASSPEGGGLLPAGCDVAGRMEVVRDFFKNSTMIDFDLVRVVVGGSPVHFNKDGWIAASVFENTIHLPVDLCPWNSLLVHEMVHIYQFQSGWWYGGLRRAIDYFKDSLDCKLCLYDFGGPEGLQEMFQKAKSGDPIAADITLAFGAEQMAEIVKIYYSYFYEWGDGSEYTEYGGYDYYSETWAEPEYYEALAFYAEQIVYK